MAQTPQESCCHIRPGVPDEWPVRETAALYPVGSWALQELAVSENIEN